MFCSVHVIQCEGRLSKKIFRESECGPRPGGGQYAGGLHAILISLVQILYPEK